MHQHDEETQVLHQPEGEDNQHKADHLETKLHTNSRQNFVKKVYGILCTQLVLTSIFVIIAALNESVNLYLRKSLALFIICFVVTMITMYSLFCYKEVARTVPWNYVLLFVFTLAESYMV
jgi:FtsH-binding integral membrane protein